MGASGSLPDIPDPTQVNTFNFGHLLIAISGISARQVRREQRLGLERNTRWTSWPALHRVSQGRLRDELAHHELQSFLP
jgi:hypothetical protein